MCVNDQNIFLKEMADKTQLTRENTCALNDLVISPHLVNTQFFEYFWKIMC